MDSREGRGAGRRVNGHHAPNDASRKFSEKRSWRQVALVRALDLRVVFFYFIFFFLSLSLSLSLSLVIPRPWPSRGEPAVIHKNMPDAFLSSRRGNFPQGQPGGRERRPQELRGGPRDSSLPRVEGRPGPPGKLNRHSAPTIYR
jgi:hypothetical protein